MADPIQKGNVLFPVFFKLNQLETLVVGGGYVGHEKLSALLGNDPEARITVVSPHFLPDIMEMERQYKNLRLIKRKFKPEDLEGKQLIICAANNRSLHEVIQQLAKARGQLINVADTPDLCDFYLSSIVKKGDLKVAISTNGKSPTMAKRIKEFLNNVIPPDIQESLDNLRTIRENIKGDFQDKVRQLNEHTKSMIY